MSLFDDESSTTEEVVEEKVEEVKKNEKASKSIQSSWMDPVTRQKRLRRIAVEVGGTQYQSCRKAFKELGLDVKKSDSVRAHLKTKGDTTQFEGHTFVAVS